MLVEDPAVDQHDRIGRRVDPFDLSQDQVDAVRDAALTRLDRLLRRVDPERQQQEAGLVEVDIVLVDHGDLPSLDPPTGRGEGRRSHPDEYMDAPP